MSVTCILHIELRVNGRWEHYSHCVPRADPDFLALISTKIPGHDSLVPARPVPTDISTLTRLDPTFDTAFIRYASFVQGNEIVQLSDKWRAAQRSKRKDGQWADLEEVVLCRTYFYGNSFSSFFLFDKTDPLKLIQDIRFVFWFI